MPENIEDLRRRILGDDVVDEEEVEPLIQRERKMTTLTVEELLRICVENSDHPLSKIKARSVKGMAPNQKVSVEKLDLQAIVENCEIEESHVVEHGRKVNRKKLGPKLKAKEKKPEPATPVKA